MMAPAPRVLITRPLADAEPLARRVAALGFEPVIEPLLDIRFLDGVPVALDGIGALAFTSANGVRALARAAPEAVGAGLPAFAVGAATAEAARTAGFGKVEAAAGDLASLARLIADRHASGAGAILHVAGRERAGDLVAALAAHGIAARRAVLYAAEAREAFSPEARRLMAAGGIAAVLIFSPRTARLFVTLLGRAGLADSAKAMRLVALSPRVAVAASAAPWAAVETAPRPDLEAILETLARTDGSR